MVLRLTDGGDTHAQATDVGRGLPAGQPLGRTCHDSPRPVGCGIVLSSVEKTQIIEEIKRTAAANGGTPLGWRRFEEETGIRYYDWYGRHWTRWSDAVQEAGLSPNRMSEAYTKESLVESLVTLTKELGRVPTQGDLLMAARRNVGFPSEKVFRKLGHKATRAALVTAYCSVRNGLSEVGALWSKAIPVAATKTEDDLQRDAGPAGYVYLMRHGSRREYKLGRTNNPIRREGEIGVQLPEVLSPVHYIATDDPAGIETYWHQRFASKRKEGEWFALTADDVRAFKRWRRIF